MSARIESVHPVLMSSDVEGSLRFYRRLGFGELFRDRPIDPHYAGVGRDGVEFHLQWQDASQWAQTIDRPTYRFLVSDVDALHAELLAADALPPSSSPWAAPGNTPWGTREFHVHDPDGNGLQFYRAL